VIGGRLAIEGGGLCRSEYFFRLLPYRFADYLRRGFEVEVGERVQVLWRELPPAKRSNKSWDYIGYVPSCRDWGSFAFWSSSAEETIYTGRAFQIGRLDM
jgi:hypothetical protein